MKIKSFYVRMYKVFISLGFGLVFLLGAVTQYGWTQEMDVMEFVKQYGENVKKNAALMHQYSWKMRIQLTVKGEIKEPQLYHLRFDANGKLQKTLLTPPKKQKKRRGLRKRMANKKIAEVKQWIARLSELFTRYAAPSSGTLLDFCQKANFKFLNDNTRQAQGTGLLQADDTVTFWFDVKTYQLRKFSFSTTLNGDLVQGSIQYSNLQNGPTFAALSTVEVPNKQVSAKIENFDFLRQ